MADTLTGTFQNRDSAERALDALTSAGFTAHLSNTPPTTTTYEPGAQGAVLVSVDAQDREAEAQQLLLTSGATKVDPADTQQTDDDTIGGIAPAAVTDAIPPRQADNGTIGGIAPAAVTSAESPASLMATSNDGYDTQARQTSSAPADSTILSPGMEIPYTERQAQSGNTSERHPITDEDIIADAQGEPERDQSADLDVPPASDEQDADPRTER